MRSPSVSLVPISLMIGLILGSVFLWFFLPEMRNRTLEEIDELFQERVPTRQFHKYQCVSSERAREQAIKVVGIEADVDGDEKTMEVEHREVKA